MDDGRTLGFVNNQEVSYADEKSGSEGISMFFCIIGAANGIIEPPLMIFINKNRNYPMRKIPNNILCVAYRTVPKQWMKSINMTERLLQSRVIKSFPNAKLHHLYIDN